MPLIVIWLNRNVAEEYQNKHCFCVFEYGKLEKATRVISIWDPNHESLEWRTIELYYDYADLNEQFVIRLLSEGVNIQLLQRCIALIWGGLVKIVFFQQGF